MKKTYIDLYELKLNILKMMGTMEKVSAKDIAKLLDMMPKVEIEEANGENEK